MSFFSIEGKGGISARVIADSINPFTGDRLTTLQLRYPRFIHSEFMTHRMFSRNASSSRAIPVTKMMEMVQNDPAMPIHWGANRKGMQAREEVENIDICREEWEDSASSALYHVRELNIQGLHKQVTNRILEPFQFISVVCTATEWDNFFNLRLHPDAQPEIHVLAVVMLDAMDTSHPKSLQVGQFHLPYVDEYDESGNPSYYDDPTEALKCSTARCARVSYLNHDQSSPSVEKDIELHDMLLSSGHMSPFEHQAMIHHTDDFVDGITHVDRKGHFWSGNLRGFIQYRNLVESH